MTQSVEREGEGGEREREREREREGERERKMRALIKAMPNQTLLNLLNDISTFWGLPS